MPVKPRPGARQRVLEAAAQVAGDVGAANLTLDAVAAAAGVSKGGLLYHFAGKEALLKGLVDHHIEEHDAHLADACGRYPDTPSGYLRAYLQTKIAHAKDDLHKAAATRSFLTAAANFPVLLERPRQHAGRHFDRMREAGAGFPDAALLSLALDGLFFADVFEISPLSDGERQAILDRLLQLAEQLDAGPTARGARKSPSKAGSGT